MQGHTPVVYFGRNSRMRNRWWSWGAGLLAALVITAVVLPQTSDAQTGRTSAMSSSGGGNSKMMRKMMMMRKMRKRQAMMQGRQGNPSGTTNAAGS
jgi:hypothetical protein